MALSTALLFAALCASPFFCSAVPFTGFCADYLAQYPNAPSGPYEFLTCSGGVLIHVWCEMGLNGGGYTIIRPDSFANVTDDDFACLRNRSSILVFPRICSGLPEYYIFENLPSVNSSLQISMNNYTGYTTPVNVPAFGGPCLFVGFEPANTIDLTDTDDVHGFTANGQNFEFTFSNASSPPTNDSYMVFCPNFAEVSPPVLENSSANNTLLVQTFAASDAVPSGRQISNEYFVYWEGNTANQLVFQTSPQERSKLCVISACVGFR